MVEVLVRPLAPAALSRSSPANDGAPTTRAAEAPLTHVLVTLVEDDLRYLVVGAVTLILHHTGSEAPPVGPREEARISE